jgi:hypothetical protein
MPSRDLGGQCNCFVSFSVLSLDDLPEGWRGGLRQLREQGLGDLLHAGCAVYLKGLGARPEVMNSGQRPRLGVVVDSVALIDRRFILVVGPGGQFVAAANAADRLPLLFGRLDRVDEDVVGMVVVRGAETAAHDPLLGDLPVEDDLDDVVEFHSGFLERLPEGLRLSEVSGEAVEKPAVFTVRLPEAVQDHGDGDLIGNKLAAVNEVLCLFTEFRSILNICSENYTGLDVGDAVLLLNHSALCPLSTAIRSENQNVHVHELLSQGQISGLRCQLKMENASVLM